MASVTITKRGNFSWRLRVRYKDHPSGEMRERSYTVRGTEEYALAQKRLLLDGFAYGKMERVSTDTVSGYVSAWIAHRVAMGQIRPTTADTYKKVLKEFLSRFGNNPLIAVRPDEVRSWLTSLIQIKGRAFGQYNYTVLKTVFKSAVLSGDIPFNPFDRVERPATPTRHKEHAISGAKLREIWSATDRMPERQKLAVSLALETGMRRGELAGLRWEDFNSDCTALHVKRTVVVSERKIFPQEPKTKSSKRKIALSAKLAGCLQAVRNEGYLFGHEELPPHPEQISRLLKGALREVGIENMSAHDFRHAHATHLLRNKIPLVAVARRLGHSKVTTTMDIYAHALAEDEDDILRTVDTLLRI